MPPDMTVRQSHDISLALQHKVRGDGGGRSLGGAYVKDAAYVCSRQICYWSVGERLRRPSCVEVLDSEALFPFISFV